jgi:hypothetical protein
VLRNELIVLLSQWDNDTVTVNVDGAFCDIRAVSAKGGCIVLVLNHEVSATTIPGSETGVPDGTQNGRNG